MTSNLAAAPAALLQGLALSLGLIVAIGAQNAFVLRQGLRREHVGPVVLFCAAADALLI
ncbi:amino acid transporter, partial [Paucibacter sp. XJ19-41]|nr:amino acid transporter [Paucibacter sp. XJ19-41]